MWSAAFVAEKCRSGDVDVELHRQVSEGVYYPILRYCIKVCPQIRDEFGFFLKGKNTKDNPKLWNITSVEKLTLIDEKDVLDSDGYVTNFTPKRLVNGRRRGF